jgi:cytochrome P450
MLELAKNPTEQSKLRVALQEYVENGRPGELLDLKQCPHVKMVARESLRLHPTAALSSTCVVQKELAIPNPQDTSETWIIPKGSLCNVISCVILRNHHVLGDFADQFNLCR